MAAADDVRAMLATSEDVFVFGATSSACFFSTFDDEVAMDNVGASKQVVRRSYALVCADDFPNLAEDDLVTVNGTGYVVLDTRLVQDGHVMQVNLQLGGN